MINLKEIVWKCRRGMLELDLILNRFLQNQYYKLSNEQQQAFIRLLDQPDPILAAWLFEVESPNDLEFIEILRKIRKVLGHSA